MCCGFARATTSPFVLIGRGSKPAGERRAGFAASLFAWRIRISAALEIPVIGCCLRRWPKLKLVAVEVQA